jgi:hopanoid biosynthesis associated protein HpnK
LRRLIINADDLGLTTGVNRAIEQAHTAGLVTSSTLMANSAAFEDAVAISRRNPKLSIGCHVTLADGAPLLRADQVPTLLDGDRFPVSFVSFAQRALRGCIRSAEVTAEAVAQIRKLQAAGVAVSHVDTHKHLHMFRVVLEPLLAAARECGVRAIRNPFAPVKPLAFAHLLRRPRLWTRYSEVKLLAPLQAGFAQKVRAAGLLTTDGSFGVVSTGALDGKLFAAIVGCIPEGTWEFVCHPGYNDAELAGIKTRLRASRVKELEVLTSPEARKILEQRGIEMISFRDLALGAQG